MAVQRNYKIQKHNHNGIHEIVIVQNGNDALKIGTLILLTVLSIEVALQRVCTFYYRIAIGVFIFYFSVQRVVKVSEKITIIPEYGLYFEQCSFLGLNKHSFFIAQQDIQCVVINEIFTDQSSVMTMLCVMHQNTFDHVTVLFRKTKPCLRDVIDLYNIAYDCFN